MVKYQSRDLLSAGPGSCSLVSESDAARLDAGIGHSSSPPVLLIGTDFTNWALRYTLPCSRGKPGEIRVKCFWGLHHQ